jgi:lipase chaperone LimK
MSQYVSYKNALSERMEKEIEIHRLTCKLIMKSWWASWLPFGWMHSLAARYYANKAQRLYDNQKEVAR